MVRIHSHFTLRFLATVALLLLVSSSSAPAIQTGFLGGRGEVKTFPFKGQVVRVSGSNFTMTRKMVGSGRALQVNFTLTANTIYVGGSQDGLIAGAKARVSFHFDASNSNIAYADTVQFLSGR
jgi:hypothetical protein